MAPDTCKTKISANTLLGQLNGSLIGYLANIGAPGTRKHQNFIRFTKAFFFHFAPSSLFDPSLDLFNFWNFSRYLHHSVNNQSRSYKHPIIGDGFNVFHLGDLGFNTQLLDCFFSSLLELIAFRSTHSENLDLFHNFLLLQIKFLMTIYFRIVRANP